MDDFVTSAEDYLQGVKSQILDSLFLSIDDLDAGSNIIINRVASDINRILDNADLTTETTASKALASILDIGYEAKNDLSHYERSIVDRLGEDASGTELVAAAIKKDISDAFDSYAIEVEGGVTTIIQKAAVPPEPITKVVTAPSAEIPVSLIEAVRAIPETLVGIGNAVALFSKLGDLSDLMHSPDIELKDTKEAIQKKPEGFAADTWGGLVDSLAKLGAVTGAPFGFFPIFGEAHSAGMGAVIENVARVDFRPSRMALIELATSYVRGQIDEVKLFNDGSELGFRDEDIEGYVKLARQFISSEDLLKLWLRGDITDRQLDFRLTQLGVAESDIKLIKSLVFYIPGVNDLIRMAVREAFTPEIAEKFGQYEDYPPALTEFAVKQGLSEEWAKRYWAAHWELPSPQMGFEMMWRGIITQDELKMLLRALDVMPYWRDKLIQLSFQPITRVDIRRFHKMGILSDADLPNRYERIGYSPEDALLQARFTIQINQDEAKIEAQPQKDLTASEILSAYANILIGGDDARALLGELGYEGFEIDFKMALAELPALKRVRDKKIEIIRQRLLYGAIDINGAVDELNKLDMPPYEMDYQLLDFQQDLELAALKEGAKSAK